MDTRNFPHNLTMTKSELAKLIALENANIIELVRIINAIIGDGSPKAVFPTLFDLEEAHPDGELGIYLVEQDGHWYFFNGIEWYDGGVYQSRGIGNGVVTEINLAPDLLEKIENITYYEDLSEDMLRRLNAHLTSTNAHTSNNISYSGLVVANNVKAAIDALSSRVSSIVAQSGNSNTEIVDARNGFPTLGDRLNANQLTTTQQINAISPETTSGTAFYVSTTGSNTNNGSQAFPFRTITKAVSMVKKSLYSSVKIRVLPGDYSDEGKVILNSFNTNYLMITAFNGAADVTTLSDDYIVEGFGIYNCGWVQLIGFRLIDPGTTYGVFCENTRYLKCLSLKNIGTGANSGFGITVNSVALFENCLCANKSTVVSVNFGSRIISKGWAAGSINNTNGLWAHGGSIIHDWDGILPIATRPIITDDGGTAFDRYGNSYGAKAVYQRTSSITADHVGNFEVTIDLSRKPSWISLDVCINGTKLLSVGKWERGHVSCIYSNSVGNTMAGNVAQLNDGAGNAIYLEVVDVASDKITFSKGNAGTLSGTVRLNILCGV